MARPTKRWCPQGHDTHLTGRYTNSGCVICAKTRARAKQRANCRRGHSYAVVGRTKGGRCKECARAYYARKDIERHANMVPAQRLRILLTHRKPYTKVSVEQTIAAKDRAADAWSRHWNVKENSAHKRVDALWKADRISIDTADRWCCALGIHLILVYPELYYFGEQEPETEAAA